MFSPPPQGYKGHRPTDDLQGYGKSYWAQGGVEGDHLGVADYTR